MSRSATAAAAAALWHLRRRRQETQASDRQQRFHFAAGFSFFSPKKKRRKQKKSSINVQISGQRTHCFRVQLVSRLRQNFIHTGLVDKGDEAEASERWRGRKNTHKRHLIFHVHHCEYFHCKSKNFRNRSDFFFFYISFFSTTNSDTPTNF